jgi:putative peptidoglycan lipid II flippase
MAGILGVLALTILFRSIYFISARSFYAQQDTKTPLYISLFTISLNIVLAIWFSMGLSMGVYGLAWAAVITSAIEVSILFTLMSRRIKGLFGDGFVHAVSRMILATSITGFVTYIMVTLLPLSASDQSFFSSFPKFAIIVAAGLLSYLVVCRLLRIEEVNPIIKRIGDVLFKQFGTHS